MKTNKIFLFALIIISGCYSTEVSDSSNVNQDAIYQDYYVTYDGETNLADASAVFRFESWQGNTLNLTSPSSIEVNGQKMSGEKEWLTGYVYRASRVKSDKNNYVFRFTDTEEKEYNNSITLDPVSIDETVSELNLSKENEINFSGKPLDKHETFRITITENDTISAEISSHIKGITSLKVTPDDLKGFVEGIANIRVDREIDKPLDQTTNVEGELQGIYRSEIHSVKITL